MKITIFTPVYNRRNQIENLYNSLRRQKNYDFEWIVVDDGSTDCPGELIEKWKEEETLFDIVFLKQKNGGKHRAMNLGIQKARGEFFLTCDSDDFLTDDAIVLLQEWLKDIENNPDIKGVAGLKTTPDGEFLLWKKNDENSFDICGGKPDFSGFVDATCSDCLKYGLYGDKCEVVKTEVIRNYLFPEIDGENFLTESVMWNRMSKDGICFRWHDRAIEVCEYREDGLTNQGMNKFIANPKGYGLYIRDNICSEEYRRERFYDYYAQLKNMLTEEEIKENIGVDDLNDIKKVGRERLNQRLNELDVMEEVVKSKLSLKMAGEEYYQQMKSQLEELLMTVVRNKKECIAVLDNPEDDVMIAIEENRRNVLKELDSL